jgi:hypothetical protein
VHGRVGAGVGLCGVGTLASPFVALKLTIFQCPIQLLQTLQMLQVPQVPQTTLLPYPQLTHLGTLVSKSSLKFVKHPCA